MLTEVFGGAKLHKEDEGRGLHTSTALPTAGKSIARLVHPRGQTMPTSPTQRLD